MPSRICGSYKNNLQDSVLSYYVSRVSTGCQDLQQTPLPVESSHCSPPPVSSFRGKVSPEPEVCIFSGEIQQTPAILPLPLS